MNRRAFTLIELLIVVAIMSIITASMTEIVLTLHRTSRFVVHETRARSVLASERDWLLSGPHLPTDGEWYELPMDPTLFAEIPDATGVYRCRPTEIPSLYRLTLELTWRAPMNDMTVQREWLVVWEEDGP